MGHTLDGQPRSTADARRMVRSCVAGPVPAERERVAWCVRWLREEYGGLSRWTAARRTRFRMARIAAFETACDGVPTRYAGRLLRVCEMEPDAFIDLLFAPTDWPRDPATFTPLPADARALESLLRLWRTEPTGANASLRRLVEATLGGAPSH